MHTCVCFLCSLLFLLAFVCCCCCFPSWFVLFSSCFSPSSLHLRMPALCIYIVDYTVYDMRTVNRGALNTKSKDRTEEKESKKGEKHREKFLLLLLLLFWLLQWRRPRIELRKIVFFLISNEFWSKISPIFFATIRKILTFKRFDFFLVGSNQNARHCIPLFSLCLPSHCVDISLLIFLCNCVHVCVSVLSAYAIVTCCCSWNKKMKRVNSKVIERSTERKRKK